MKHGNSSLNLKKPPVIKRSSTPNGVHNHGQEQNKILSEDKIQEILSSPIIDLEKLRSKSWAGFSNKFRAQIWRLFLDYEPVNSAVRKTALEHKRNDYLDCVKRVLDQSLWTNTQKQTETQILRDLPRTHLALLRDKKVMELFKKVLFVWAVRHPACGYVQGMNDLLQPFFFAFLNQFCQDKDIDEIIQMKNCDFLDDEAFRIIEADCFWCFSKLMDGLQDLYTKDQPGLYKMLDSLSFLIQRVNPKLSQLIKEENIDYQEFAFRWMNCLLVREFSPKLLLRLWDFYLSNHSKISSTHIYVCAALLTTLSPELLGLNHNDFIMKIQTIDPDRWSFEDFDMIIAQSYVYEKMFSHSPSHLRSSSLPLFQLNQKK